jgi:hypothetical protein
MTDDLRDSEAENATAEPAEPDVDPVDKALSAPFADFVSDMIMDVQRDKAKAVIAALMDMRDQMFTKRDAAVSEVNESTQVIALCEKRLKTISKGGPAAAALFKLSRSKRCSRHPQHTYNEFVFESCPFCAEL